MTTTTAAAAAATPRRGSPLPLVVAGLLASRSNCRQTRLRTQTQKVPLQPARCHQTAPLAHLQQGAVAAVPPAVPVRTW